MKQFNIIKPRAKFALFIFGLILSGFIFQNCSNVEFTSIRPDDDVDGLGNPPVVCDPLVSSNMSVPGCDDVETGFQGKIYYFLNKDSSGNRPTEVFDKFDASIVFPSGVNNVGMFFERAYQLEAKVVLSKINVPVIIFSDGFKDTSGNFIKDAAGNRLIEAFALRVEGKFHVDNNLEEGNYEFALLSDDGAILSADKDGDGNYSVLVNNDGLHSARLACSASTVEMKKGQSLPIRVDYYQGPRTEIAITLLARRVTSSTVSETLCGHQSRTEWFNGEPTDAGYVPDFTGGLYGELINRGWFVPDANAVNK